MNQRGDKEAHGRFGQKFEREINSRREKEKRAKGVSEDLKDKRGRGHRDRERLGQDEKREI